MTNLDGPSKPRHIRRRLLEATLIVVAIAGVLYGRPCRNAYCRVDATVERWPRASLIHTESWLPDADHMVRDGALYLRVQSTRSTWVGMVVVSTVEWNADMIRRYRATHPELEGLWPGHPVRWLRH